MWSCDPLETSPGSPLLADLAQTVEDDLLLVGERLAEVLGQELLLPQLALQDLQLPRQLLLLAATARVTAPADVSRAVNRGSRSFHNARRDTSLDTVRN